jgi:hypothetical protein
MDTVDLAPLLTAAEGLLSAHTEYEEFISLTGTNSPVIANHLVCAVRLAADRLAHDLTAAVPGNVILREVGKSPWKNDALGMLRSGTVRLRQGIADYPGTVKVFNSGGPSQVLCIPAGETFQFDPTAIGEIKAAVARLRKHLPVPTPASPNSEAPTPPNLFARLSGERYQIRFAGKEEIVPMLAGLQVVQYLIKQPGKAAHVMEINRALYEGNPRAAAIEDAFTRSGEQKAMDGFTSEASRTPDTCSAQELKDAKEALTSLEEQAVQAWEGGEHDKANRLDASVDQTRQWIKEAEALQRRNRRRQPDQGSQAEKVRVKLTNNFTNACDALRARYGLSELADHLEEQIDRGTEFKYRPVAGVEWAFDPTSR